jgi:hypothetical protein
MTAPLTLDPAEIALPKAAPRPPRFNWLHEPLLHFVVLGGLLFAVDHYIASKTDDRYTIVVGADVDMDAIETFRTARGREPNQQELEALHRVWIDNEVLYREGLALGVERGDPDIRERVIFKALNVVDSNVKLPAIDDKALRAWFEEHRSKYDDPARFDFEEAALSGDTSEAAVRYFVKALNAGTPGDAKAGLRVFKGRPRQNLVDSYGPEFANAIEAAEPGVWQPLKTREGWRAMKLDAKTASKPAVFESIRGVVRQDWTDREAAEQRTAAVRKLATKYKIKYEAPLKGDKE